jgi:hypothetical protein
MNKFTKRLKIDEAFPKKKFNDIMRPYLNIYYTSLFSLNISERNTSAADLNDKLRRFYNFNPKFGRRHIRIKKYSSTVKTFNDTCIEFCGKKYFDSYSKSHLDIDEDESESESESEDQEFINNIVFSSVDNNVERVPSFVFNSINEEDEDNDEECDDDDEHDFNNFELNM